MRRFFSSTTRYLRAPRLGLFAPDKDLATTETAFKVRGRTDPDADVSLSGRPLFVGSTEEFSERIYLIKGFNRLEFEAKNRYGQTTAKTRSIVVQ